MSTLTAHGVSVSFGAVAVLHNADLVVAPGDRIAVVGPNGVGKSTLLRVLAGLVPPDAGTVSAAGTVGYLPQERDRRDDETAMEYIARRAGVAAAEAAMLAASDRLARASDSDQANGQAAGRAAGRASDRAADRAAERASETYAAALDTYLALGGPDLEVRASELAASLGLPADLDRPATGLSGGQAARLALAAVLLARFDVLLLDEPTNDLDLTGLELLESHLAAFRGGLVVVSHDRAFLERTARQVLQIDPHTREVKLYGGGYQAYREELERDRARAAEAYETYAATRDDLIERARRQKEWARSGERSAKSATARRKEPDKNIRRGRVEGAQHQAARGAATLRAAERLEPVAEPRKEWELRLRFGAAERSGDIVAVLSDAVVRRGTFQLGPVSMQLNWGERMLVQGDNGSGKTTLLQALLGRIPLAAGRGSLGASVRVGEIDQGRLTFDADARLLDAFAAESGLLESDARTLLAKFGLGADDVGRPVARLTPGERTRADLALLMHSGANLLVLDEPTNHLDLPAIEQLEQALDHYDGTLLIVTHDRRLAEHVRVTRRLTVSAGSVTEE
ncbi:MAG TPA: ABC-F family ATP-binding cassette domain-containing protein [Streptosporangiaceae bacterium]|nr:ABC-F family ATP-binding cassette domain-containing protein [Streptosporangiaceae bacterium]HVB45363.1 ABC-F family ATP-binding cassette domain-containing protein [Streptosporangiaceae bacterium]